MSRTFRVTSKYDDLKFEVLLELSELRPIEVDRELYLCLGDPAPDAEFEAEIIGKGEVRVELADEVDIMLEDIQQVEVGHQVTVAQFGERLELHCLFGALDASVRYALEEVTG